MNVGITGSSGLIGTALGEALRDAGHTPVPIVRRAPEGGEVEWDPAAGKVDPAALATFDAVVNLAGASIAGRRWSDSYRDLVRSSRVDGTALLARTFRELGDDAPEVLVSASGVNYYGDRGDELLTEQSAAGGGFLADVCRDWEAAASDAASAHTRVVRLRTGIVLARHGGALARMLLPFKFGLGGRFGSGDQWMSWITLRDHVRAILHAITTDIDGPVNATAPNPVTNREFAKTLGATLKRPAVVPLPAFAPRLALGRQMADELLFDSLRVVPAALGEHGFEFDDPDLGEALENVLPR